MDFVDYVSGIVLIVCCFIIGVSIYYSIKAEKEQIVNEEDPDNAD